jgi:hypothetical protein
MKSLAVAFSALIALLAPAAAHEVWIERDGDGPARVYLGEPNVPVTEAGDPEFPQLQTPVVFGADPAKPAALTRKTNHIEAAAEPGDVRLRDDSVFEPWEDEGKQAGVIYYARAGRTDTSAKLDLELVPVAAGGDEFVAMFRGQPLVDADIVVITPDYWQKSFKTDAAGKVSVPAMGAGRYLVNVSHTLDETGKVHGKDVAKVMHISTLTFVR